MCTSRYEHVLPCDLRWVASEDGLGLYRVTVTEERAPDPLQPHAAAVPAIDQPAVVPLVARVAGVSVPVATALVERYGSLAALRQADAAVLSHAHGLTAQEADRLTAALALATQLLLTPRTVRPQIRTPHDAARLVLPEMGLLEREQIRLLLLNTKNYLITIITLYHGTTTQCIVRVAEVMHAAITHNSVAMIVVHNHPSHDPTPSPEDIQLTREIVHAGRLLDIQVLDHIVVGGVDAYTSLRERGLGWE